MPQVNPDILVWARDTAGLSLEEAASKLNINAAYGLTAEERLLQLESGEREPSRSILLRMSKQYRRPLVAFYLSAPPRRGNRGQDFRLLPADQPEASEGLLDALVRQVLARQSLIRSAILAEDEVREIHFIDSHSVGDDVEQVLETLRDSLDITLNDYRNEPSTTKAFDVLRGSIERAGVFVLLLGNLGSHHTNLDVDTFRGFAIADSIAPFIVINDQDSRAAWSFTLLHELTHLILGQTGVSGGAALRDIEKFCNDVASRFLLSDSELAAFQGVDLSDVKSGADSIDAFAQARNLSRSLVAYRLFRHGDITESRWKEYQGRFRKLWFESREEQRIEAREKDGGPSYYVVRRHRLGTALLETTARFMMSGALSTTKAGAVLGVKPKNVQQLLESYV